MKTNRGFEIQHFIDDYGVDCSIQESSSVDPHIWLGVNNPRISIMYKDRDKLIGIDKVEKDSPECNECGWCTVQLPKEALNESRMHLNRKQAKELAKKLNFFAKYGYLKENENE